MCYFLYWSSLAEKSRYLSISRAMVFKLRSFPQWRCPQSIGYWQWHFDSHMQIEFVACTCVCAAITAAQSKRALFQFRSDCNDAPNEWSKAIQCEKIEPSPPPPPDNNIVAKSCSLLSSEANRVCCWADEWDQRNDCVWTEWKIEFIPSIDRLANAINLCNFAYVANLREDFPRCIGAALSNAEGKKKWNNENDAIHHIQCALTSWPVPMVDRRSFAVWPSSERLFTS